MLRYGLIVLLITGLFTGCFYLSLHFTRAQTLQSDINRLVSVQEDSDVADSCIAALQHADKSISLHQATGDSLHLRQYTAEIAVASSLIAALKPGDDNLSLNGLPRRRINAGADYRRMTSLITRLKAIPPEFQPDRRPAAESYYGGQAGPNTITGTISLLISNLKIFKKKQQGYLYQRKDVLRGTLTTVFSEFSRLSLFTVLVLTILISTLLYNIWKIFHNEKALVTFSEKAGRYADAKSSFLAGMSHEIRTPLNSIIGFAEQLEQEALPPRPAEQVKAIRSSSGMLLEVVNQILDFSKYETGKMNIGHSPFHPSEVLGEVIATMRILAEKKGLALNQEFLFDAGLCVAGDAFRLKQVVVNLLSNAIKFTKAGEVRLKAWVADAAGDRLVLYAEVKDTGVGIDKQHLPLVFNEFSQVAAAQSDKHKGTGLGLAICKKIVELQQGTIRVKSSPGKGSEFSFHIPYDKVQDSPCKSGIGPEALDIGQQVLSKHILLAEDNKMSALLAKTILTKWKMTCDVAVNGIEALALFEKNGYDLVLTDIEMPELGGVELVKLIRLSDDARKATVPVLALTAHVMKEDHDHYLDAGIDAIAVKPLLERDLVEKIAQCLERRKSLITG